MDICPALITNRQPAEAVEPSKRALHNPPMLSQAFSGFDPAARDAVLNMACTTSAPAAGEVVSLVCVEFSGTSPRRATPAADGLYAIEHFVEAHGVMLVRRPQVIGERNPVPVDNQVVLGSWAATVDRVGPGIRAPPFAGTLEASSAALDQSIRSPACRSTSKTRCNSLHTPASFQSRSRRQHVIPLPQPISSGSISQGIPLRRTNRMPVSAARSGTAGRPPLGLRLRFGNSGSTRAHKSSPTNALFTRRVVTRSDPVSSFRSQFC